MTILSLALLIWNRSAAGEPLAVAGRSWGENITYLPFCYTLTQYVFACSCCRRQHAAQNGHLLLLGIGIFVLICGYLGNLYSKITHPQVCEDLPEPPSSSMFQIHLWDGCFDIWYGAISNPSKEKAIKEICLVNKLFGNKFWLLFRCFQPLESKMHRKQQKCVYNHILCN